MFPHLPQMLEFSRRAIEDKTKRNTKIEYEICDERLEKKRKPVENTCCNRKLLINDEGKIVCKHCGQIKEYLYVNEGIDFYKDMYRIQRKSR